MAIRQTLRQSSVPLYAQIADLMRHRIRRGVWPADRQLPTLEELAGEFGVARLTIKQAMDVLAAEGLVSRYRGRGTFVRRAPSDERWLRLQTTLDTFWAMYEGTRTRMLAEHVGTMPALTPADGTAAAAYHCMRRLNSRDGVALSVATVYLDEAIFRRDPVRFRAETVVSILLETPDVIAAARQTLTIGVADVEDAELLGVPLNSPTAEVRRVFNDAAGTAIYVAEATYPGDFVRIELDLK